MKFTISADCRRGLRVINEIPNMPLCKIEGHNGVGKSTGIKLLQLCTGEQPYDRELQAWKTLRDQLHSATVRVSDLEGAGSIEWIIEPALWPEKPDQLGNSIGRIRNDGREAHLNDVRGLLRVHRLVGNETLSETLAQQCGEAAAAVSQWISDSGPAWQRRSELDDLLANVEDLIPDIDMSTYHSRRRSAVDAASKARDAESQLVRSKARLDLLQNIVELSDQLEDVRGQGPGLDNQLELLEREVASVEGERDRLDAEIAEVAEREQKDELARTAFKNATRLANKRQAEVQQAQAHLSELSQAAGVPLERGPIEASLEETEQLLNNLRDRLPQADAGPAMRGLLQKIVEELGNAETLGLGNELILEGDLLRPEWTVRTLREALERQSEVRRKQRPSRSANELVEQIESLAGRAETLSTLVEAYGKLDDALRLSAAAVSRLETATSKLPNETATTLRQMLSNRTEHENRLVTLTLRLKQIRQARELLGGGLNERSLHQQITEKCNEAGIELSRLRPELFSMQRLHDDQQAAAANANAVAESTNFELEKIARDTAGAAAAVGEVSWLDAATRSSLTASSEVESQLQVLVRVKARVDESRSRLDRFTYQVAAIADALRNEESRFRGGQFTGNWVPEVRGWIGQQVTTWFDHPEVRSTLFPGADNVSLNVETMEATWTRAGEEQTRALQAFSSGEQALAYTRARLASLEHEDTQAANRLIALDEFGAFIAADGMQSLAAYLRQRRGILPRDQVVVVLPLSPQFASGIVEDGLPGNAQRREQLRARGYFAEEFV